MLKYAGSIPAVAETAPIYTVHEVLRGYCPWESGGGCCNQLIGPTVSDAIVHSWLWLTATRSSPLGYFSRLLQVVIIDPTFCDSRFSTEWLLAIEDFTFFLMHLSPFYFWLCRQSIIIIIIILLNVWNEIYRKTVQLLGVLLYKWSKMVNEKHVL